MPNFDRSALRKGSKAIDEALEARKSGGGDFKPFLPSIFWKKANDYRYLMFLNPLEEIPEVDLHPFIDLDDDKPHMAIARTWKPIGEAKDPIQDRWGYKPRLTDLAVAVVLEPITEIIDSRPKPVGFEVATTSFNRTVRDDNGKPVEGQKEEVTVPVVGLVAQSPYNFFNQLRSFDATEAAIHATPVKITRLGEKQNVTFTVVGYDQITPDLSNLFDFIDNMSYIDDGDKEDLIDRISDAESDIEAAGIIGDYLLYKRLDELADPDLYNEILGQITKPAKFQDQSANKESGKPTGKRPSQRRRPAPAATETETPTEQPTTQEDARNQRMAKLRARSRTAKKTESE